ncbi:glycosylphosphatidylinositol-anchored high density lipoprotein-binding protein 1 isoform X2 [Perognathus longimembris pacificus]|uniref:glycosylphosphatidylinositol-anchored high density lipoprotein-binding protein 1 isoform X2 n=1 Tax=Perognathus longimembris pacificus TaxID=214514 RepID=UPI002019865C|nr:glycosylphosphatidylinositol-anchored high density lipoprotein-binding protein 1 isoform X2 [Perognathus longimembris pacificus]
MRALGAALLALLLCGQPGHRLAQEDEDEDSKPEGYDDDDEDEDEEEAPTAFGSRDRAPLECYVCMMLQGGESCKETKRCSRGQAFCTAMVYHGHTGSGLLTTSSMWCTDACRPFTKTVEGTQMTQTCCQSRLCNAPPWQSPPGGTGSPQGGRTGRPQEDRPGPPPGSGAQGLLGCPRCLSTALLLTLLASAWTAGA